MASLEERDMISMFEACPKGVVSLFYPRIYEGIPQNYCSPKYVAAIMASQNKNIPDYAYTHLKNVPDGVGSPFSIPIAMKLSANSMPTMWISPTLIEAMKHTTPPGKYDLLNLQYPLAAMTFLLPKGALPTRSGDVRFISYARFSQESFHPSLKAESAHLYFMSCTEDTSMQTLSMSSKSSVVDLGDLDAFMNNINRPGNLWKDDTGKGTDDEQNKRAIFFFLNILLILNSRPELNQPATLLKRVHKKGKEPREFWTPNILGANYAARRDGSPVGEHQSPRVRGFYRNQAVGPRKAEDRQHKLMWIEPFLRGV